MSEVLNISDKDIIYIDFPVQPDNYETPYYSQNYEEKLSIFRALPMYAQKSKGWLDQRQRYLTGSTIAKALGYGYNKAKDKRDLLFEKASLGKEKPFKGNSATCWGNKYEPVANSIYSHRNGDVKIEEFGMISNPRYPILGVSPDGILSDRMLEIKCPKKREIDGHVKDEYYHQMQEQMTVCEYDKCDFLECKFEEVSVADFGAEDGGMDKKGERGIIIAYIKPNEDETYLEYIYSPIEIQDIDGLMKWQDSQLDELWNDTQRVYMFSTYWKLRKYSCQLVKCDPQWITNYYPILESFWRDVLYYRAVGYKKIPYNIYETILPDLAKSKSNGDNDEDTSSAKNAPTECLL